MHEETCIISILFNSFIVCHHKLSFQVTMTLFLFKTPVLQMCHTTFKIVIQLFSELLLMKYCLFFFWNMFLCYIHIHAHIGGVIDMGQKEVHTWCMIVWLNLYPSYMCCSSLVCICLDLFVHYLPSLERERVLCVTRLWTESCIALSLANKIHVRWKISKISQFGVTKCTNDPYVTQTFKHGHALSWGIWV